MEQTIKYDNSDPFNYIPLIQACFYALKKLGGTGSNSEIYELAVEILNPSEDVINKPHKDKDGITELDYRLGWSRSLLKMNGILINTKQGYWIITPEFREKEFITKEEAKEISTSRNKLSRGEKRKKPEDTKETNRQESNLQLGVDETNDEVDTEDIYNREDFKIKMLNELKSMDPYAFEILTGVLLRTCGFKKIVITKKSQDGGVDGTANLYLNGLVAYKIAFQCKRYSNSHVGNQEIDQFNSAAIVENAEKKLFITTSDYTKEAYEHANHLNITLINGNALVDLLIDRRIGCTAVEGYCLDNNYFKNLNK